MESIKLFSHVATDGKLRLETATNLKDTDVEVVIVIQPLSSESEKGKKRDMTKLIEGFRSLRQEILLSEEPIRDMIEEGRRF